MENKKGKLMSLARVESATTILLTAVICLSMWTNFSNGMVEMKGDIGRNSEMIETLSLQIKELSALSGVIGKLNGELGTAAAAHAALAEGLKSTSANLGTLGLTLARIDERLKTIERSVAP
jgi:hypothetical protein